MSFAFVEIRGADIYTDRNGSEPVLKTKSSASTHTFLEINTLYLWDAGILE